MAAGRFHWPPKRLTRPDVQAAITVVARRDLNRDSRESTLPARTSPARTSPARTSPAPISPARTSPGRNSTTLNGLKTGQFHRAGNWRPARADWREQTPDLQRRTRSQVIRFNALQKLRLPSVPGIPLSPWKTSQSLNGTDRIVTHTVIHRKGLVTITK
jgi:hypothetical protein